ncbi:MAG: hypothetical protein IJS74_04015 [Clostridia bacterium]|nr:hypothetical protein [Clostridia bacterium]
MEKFNFKIIEEYRIIHKMTVQKFCDNSNIPIKAYYKLKNGNLRVDINYFINIVNATKISPANFFTR